ncbi:hypothetical protein [Parvicella tangerina]|uniref:Uncharacterized protein n=1 Tax=Parvicella tangerina TaxID=2829795 RepID=A0A916JRH7_9FLAO|nr:hypothetical protein [Parvicella tangerina]CAG5087436.1 hypothetical protein CRYO30217_03482 [Parvicella tangerina]
MSDKMNDINNQIRLKQMEMNTEQDPAKRQKLAGDLAVLQAKKKYIETKQRNQ